MEPSSAPTPQIKTPWLTLVSACLTTAIVVGGGVYVWTKNQATAPAPIAKPIEATTPKLPSGSPLSDLLPGDAPTIPTTTPPPTTSTPDSAEIEKLMQGIVDPGATTAKPVLLTFTGSGFSFQYPSEYVADEKGLWTKEGDKLNRETTTPCDTCHIPMIQVKSEKGDKTLIDYILADFDLPTSSDYPTQTLKLGANEFRRANSYDLFDVTGYYIKQGDTIVALKTHFEENDNQTLKDMLATLKFE